MKAAKIIAFISLFLIFTSLCLTACNQAFTPPPTSIGEAGALEAAKRYTKALALCKNKVVEMLEYDGYTSDEINYAIAYCGVDWNEEAIEAANNALSIAAYSKEGIEKLLSLVGFTVEEAEYASKNCGANWKEQAAKSVAEHIDLFPSYSKEQIIELLELAGFTDEEIAYGINQVYK